jgi:hypothetical protein
MSATLTGATFYLPISQTDKLVLLALADHANDDGEGIHPGNDRLITKTSRSEATVRRALHRLEHWGVIKRVAYPAGGRGKAVEWEINVRLVYDTARAYGWTQKTRSSVTAFSKNPVILDPKPGHFVSKTRSLVIPQPSVTNITATDFQNEESTIEPGESPLAAFHRIKGS